MSINCIVVDDHTLFREGLRRLLDSEADIKVIGEACDAVGALDKVRELRPDVVLMDIGMPGMSSFEAARLIEKNYPGTRLIFLTMYEDEEYLLQCLEVGASGYVLKDAPAPKLVNAVSCLFTSRVCSTTGARVPSSSASEASRQMTPSSPIAVRPRPENEQSESRPCRRPTME